MDFVDAAAVADVIGIELEHVNFAAEYKDRVFSEFVREYPGRAYAQPRHPVQRRNQVQGLPSDHAMRLGRRKSPLVTMRGFASMPAPGLHELLKGLDPSKDQSYFLHRLNQAQLAKTLFPVGEILQD